jgi:hypothetical protein
VCIFNDKSQWSITSSVEVTSTLGILSVLFISHVLLTLYMLYLSLLFDERPKRNSIIILKSSYPSCIMVNSKTKFHPFGSPEVL